MTDAMICRDSNELTDWVGFKDSIKLIELNDSILCSFPSHVSASYNIICQLFHQSFESTVMTDELKS